MIDPPFALINGLVDSDFSISDTAPVMEEFRNRQNTASGESSGNAPAEDSVYPPSIEKMSEKWCSIQRQNPDQQKSGFAERNYVALGIGIGLLIIAFLIVIGGFAFLVWNAR